MRPESPARPQNPPVRSNDGPNQRLLRVPHPLPLLNCRHVFRVAVGLVRGCAVGKLLNPDANPSPAVAQTLVQLSVSFSGAAAISVVRQTSDSLNARFLPRAEIRTRAVLICDDDVEIDSESVEFAFRVWSSNQKRLVGFFARSHDMDLSRRTWIYTVHPDKYSILLTKAMIAKTEYLYKYSCEGGVAMVEARRMVETMRNCEDILMNFVVAEAAGTAAMLVEAKRARDWGDARNEEEGGERVKEVGLSSRRGEHRRRRGECIGEFHRLLGRMPLRYGYGKVVNSVGEQGLCAKGGRLVFCDQQLTQ